MSSLKDLKFTIDSHYSMKGLVEVYEEMAASTMREIRDAILANRDYYHHLANLSATVGEDLSLVDGHQNKQALVLFASDEGMYGDIIDKVFALFLHAVKTTANADIFIIGNSGAKLIQTIAPHTKFTLIPVPKSTTEIIKQLFIYRSVQLFFGQFQSIANQTPNTRVLTSATIESTKAQWAGDVTVKLKYLYEPSVTHIADVFAKEIFSGVFEQSFQEGELAKNASRILHLDQALTNIEKKLTLDVKRYQTLQKRVSGKKQQTQFSGYRAMQHTRKQYV